MLHDWVNIIVTVILGGIGFYFVHNYSRQMRTQLAEARRTAYAELWEITGLAAPTRLADGGWRGTLSRQERERLYRDLTTWYYRNGNGMLLDKTTRKLYLDAKHNLTCWPGDIRPQDALAPCVTKGVRNLSELSPSSHPLTRPHAYPRRVREGCDLPGQPGEPVFGLLDLFPPDMTEDEKRGCLSIRQLSLLRTQMKTDLAIYGVPWVEGLHLQDRAFLCSNGVRLQRSPWDTFLELIRLRAPSPWVDAATRPVKDECCGGNIVSSDDDRRGEP